MSVSIMIAILLGALLHATWNALVRSARDKFLDAVLVTGASGVLAACCLPFMTLPAPECRPYLGASVVIHLGYFAFVALAYQKAELSFAYPIMRGTAPALSAVVAVLVLNESPPLAGWIGVMMISVGVVVLSVDAVRFGSFSRSSLFFALSNAVVIVVYTILDGQGVRLSANAAAYTGWMFFLTAVLVVGASFLLRGRAAARYFTRNPVRGLMGGVCLIGSYGIALWAMTRVPIALVAALRETSVVFAVIIAICFLGERISLVRLLSVLMVTAGAVAIKMS